MARGLPPLDCEAVPSFLGKGGRFATQRGQAPRHKSPLATEAQQAQQGQTVFAIRLAINAQPNNSTQTMIKGHERHCRYGVRLCIGTTSP